MHTQSKWNKFILNKTSVRTNVKPTSIFLKNAINTGINARRMSKSMSVKRTSNSSKNKISASSIATNCRPAVLPSSNAKMPLKTKRNPRIPSRTQLCSIAVPTKLDRTIWRAKRYPMPPRSNSRSRWKLNRQPRWSARITWPSSSRSQKAAAKRNAWKSRFNNVWVTIYWLPKK